MALERFEVLRLVGVLRAQEAVAEPRGAVDRGLVHAADEQLRRVLGHRGDA